MIWIALTNPDQSPAKCSHDDCIGRGWYWENTNTQLTQAHIDVMPNGMDNSPPHVCMTYHTGDRQFEARSCSNGNSFTICEKPCANEGGGNNAGGCFVTRPNLGGTHAAAKAKCAEESYKLPEILTSASRQTVHNLMGKLLVVFSACGGTRIGI